MEQYLGCYLVHYGTQRLLGVQHASPLFLPVRCPLTTPAGRSMLLEKLAYERVSDIQLGRKETH